MPRTRYLSRNNMAADGGPAAIVLGGGINGLSAVRSLAHAGLYPIIVVEKKYDVAALSRYAQRFTVSTFEGEKFLWEMLQLRAGMPQGGIIMCAEDRPLITLS